MSNITDPYQILGVSPNATDDEVKKAYRELSRKYHPDANAGNPLSDLAEEKFKQVQEAYSQIMDMRNGKTGYNGYNQGTQGYSQGTQGYSQGAQGYGYNQNNNRQRYQQYGSSYGRIVVFFNECKFFKTLFNTRCLPSVDSCNLSVSFVIYSGTHITFYSAIIIFIIKTMIIA